MEIQPRIQLFIYEYFKIKFKQDMQPAPLGAFRYSLDEDICAELSFIREPEESFTSWMYDLQPRDARYVVNPDWQPVLAKRFNQIDVYDELILYHLLFTINSTLTIRPTNDYNVMNDRMKSYSFFQLSHCSVVSRFSEEQKHQLRDFFFFFYLYAHPVNEDTLYACSFNDQRLVHTQTNISLEHYFTALHDHYSAHGDQYSDDLIINPDDIQASKHLTLELLRIIEGKSSPLLIPSEEGLEAVVELINNVDLMLQLYEDDASALFEIMRGFLAENRSTLYREHCFTTLLQNYVCYILHFKFDEIHTLVDYFGSTPTWCGVIINKMFTDTIFIQRIMRLKQIDISTYPDVIAHFGEEARSIYLS
ncbi:hypothetical protein MH215_14055 [Paenibacillus sp. ACRSA]|uniref:hypothetical protein n=1 Tax=Paenibacillus sp. ACRSA TaxID=2918211 RepID=UPI001EF64572|nr:hypothetical protein [Paenibacillus sp. ACRSA]MCG7378122.1 hypothetical protein [Paenibacillus sp. ACRSA]